MPQMHFCKKCGRMKNEKEFYTSRNLEKYPPDGRLDICKPCLTMHVDNWDPETYKWILEEVDVPYIKSEWDGLLEKHQGEKITSLTILGKYLSKMKLKQWKDKRWADSETIAEEQKQQKIMQMKAQGLTEEEIEEQLNVDRTPPKPKTIAAAETAAAREATADPIGYIEIGEEEEELSKLLTDEERLNMRLKWGRAYRADQWVRLEQLYRKMMASYDIQTAGHIDTLILICKASLKANECIDAGDLEGYQKMIKVYDTLMKSGKFTAAQTKENEADVIDSIGQIVAICEKEGFIEKFYIDTPNDKVDRVIQDMQEYTRNLMVGELGLGNLIENSIKALEREKEAIAEAAAQGSEEDDEALFNYDNSIISDAELINIYKEVEEGLAEMEEEDEDYES